MYKVCVGCIVLIVQRINSYIIREYCMPITGTDYGGPSNILLTLYFQD